MEYSQHELLACSAAVLRGACGRHAGRAFATTPMPYCSGGTRRDGTGRGGPSQAAPTVTLNASRTGGGTEQWVHSEASVERVMINHSKKINLIWSVKEILRDHFERHQHGDVILPFCGGSTWEVRHGRLVEDDRERPLRRRDGRVRTAHSADATRRSTLSGGRVCRSVAERWRRRVGRRDRPAPATGGTRR